jgi:hypothetical protein
VLHRAITTIVHSPVLLHAGALVVGPRRRGSGCRGFEVESDVNIYTARLLGHFQLGWQSRSSPEDAVQTALPTQRSTCPVYLKETYGILGYDEETKQNAELMEEARGSEYGLMGGSGGQGILVAGFSKGAIAGHSVVGADASAVSSAASMVVADGSGSWSSDLKAANHLPQLYYGGISKTCFRLDKAGWQQVPFFSASDVSPSEDASSVGVAIFAEDQEAGPAVQSLLSAVRPAELRQTLWGCFRASRGGSTSMGRERRVVTRPRASVSPRVRDVCPR